MEHIKDCIAALREAAPEIDIAENELMRRHTTFAIGGPADLFVQPKTRRELTAALAVLRERNIPFLLLGNGSNMLVADAGIRGAVVCTSELDEVRVNEDNTVSAEAGALLSRIARRAEGDIDYIQRFQSNGIMDAPNATNAISHATCTTAHDLGATAIITVTKSGKTARMISKYRPMSPIIGCSTDPQVCRQLNLSWGVTPLLVEEKNCLL